MAQPDAVYDALFYNYSPDIIIDRIAGIAVVIAPRFKLKYFAKSDDDAISYALNLSNQLANASIYHIVLFKVPLSPANPYTFNSTYSLLIGNIPAKVYVNSRGLRFYNNNIGLNGVIFLNGGAQIQGPNQNYPVITGVNISNTFKGNNVAVAAGATSLAVTLSQNLNTTNYSVYVTPQWNTSVWITGKTSTGFTINFGTAAPTGGSYVDWVIFF
jgi:hypothetical protein